MAFIHSGCTCCDCCSSYTTFSPYCNQPLLYDGNYQSRVYQEVYYAPEPPAQVEVVRQRLPAPPPDVIERVVVVPQPKKYVYQVVEVPSKPPPIVKQRVVHQPPNAPVCGGTYHVHTSCPSNVVSPGIVRSTSAIQTSPSYVHTSTI